MPDDLSFTCPKCSTVNTDLINVGKGWCTTCKAYTGPVNPEAQAQQINEEEHDKTRDLVQKMRESDALGERRIGDPSIPPPADDAARR